MEKISTEELLWKYADGLCNEEEISRVKALLESNDEIRNMYTEIMSTDSILNDKKVYTLDPDFQRNLELKLKTALTDQDFSPVTIIPHYAKTVFFVLLGILGLSSMFFIPKDVLLTESSNSLSLDNTFYYNIMAVSAGILLLLYFDKFIETSKGKNQKLHFLF